MRFPIVVFQDRKLRVNETIQAAFFNDMNVDMAVWLRVDSGYLLVALQMPRRGHRCHRPGPVLLPQQVSIRAV